MEDHVCNGNYIMVTEKYLEAKRLIQANRTLSCTIKRSVPQKQCARFETQSITEIHAGARFL